MQARHDISSNFIAAYSWFDSVSEASVREHAHGMLLVYAPGGLTDFNLALPELGAPRPHTPDFIQSIATAKHFFAAHNAPFSFWMAGSLLAGDAPPADSLGFTARADHMGQHIPLANLVSPPAAPTGQAGPPLEVRRIATVSELLVLAEMIAEGWSVAAEPYKKLFTAHAERLLDPQCPKRFFLGWSENTPACCMELFVEKSTGTAGVYYVSTREAFRRQGLAGRMQYEVLAKARGEGVRAGIVLSAPGERRIMSALGFTDIGWWHEYLYEG